MDKIVTVPGKSITHVFAENAESIERILNNATNRTDGDDCG